NLFMDSRS
ncbi:hypothetical protein TNIN_355581, partial [Trichonephila inaurata madagascariensis]